MLNGYCTKVWAVSLQNEFLSKTQDIHLKRNKEKHPTNMFTC